MKKLVQFKTIHLLLIISVMFMVIKAHSQQLNKSKSDFWDHVRFGGGIGLSFGNDIFSGTLAPSAIYQFNSTAAAGLGLNFSYFERDNFYKSTVIGGSLIGLINPMPSIQLSAELEELNVNRNYDEKFVSNTDEKYWYTALFLGAGYRSGNFAVGIRYDVLYDEDKSIYGDPWMPFVRVYF